MEFKKYVRSNKIVKCVKFELVPIGNTRDAIERQKVIEEDAKRKENAAVAKKVSDSFIREFLDEYGNSAEFEWEELYNAYGDAEKYNNVAQKISEKMAKELPLALNAYISRFLKANGCDKAEVKWNSASYVDIVLPLYASLHPEYRSDNTMAAVKSLEHSSSVMFKRYFAGYEKILCGVKHGSVAMRAMENFSTLCINKHLYETACTDTRLRLDNFEKMTNIAMMNSCLSQQGIDQYNENIGGKYGTDGQIIHPGLNQMVNEWNQKNPDKKIPLFRKMKKQILSETEPAFKIEAIRSNEELLETFHILQEKSASMQENLGMVVNSIGTEKGYPVKKIYVTQVCQRKIAKKLTGKYDYFERLIEEKVIEEVKLEYFNKKGRIKDKLTKKDEKTVADMMKKHISSIYEMDEILSGVSEITVEQFFLEEYQDIAARKERALVELNACEFWNNKQKPSWDENKVIQDYMDAILEFVHMKKCFVTDIQKVDVDVFFSYNIQSMDEDSQQIVKLYNMVRNYITRKNEIEAKEKRIQLCFGRPVHFEQMWQNKQSGKFGNLDAALLEAEGKYYYIVPAALNSEKLNFPITEEPQRGENYNYLSTKKNLKLSMSLPKMTFKSPAAMKQYEATDEEFKVLVGDSTMMVSKKMYEDYEAKTFRESKEALIALINYGKEYITKDKSFREYDFSSLRSAEEYKNYGEFCAEVDAVAFKTTRKYISKELVDSAVERGDLYMFLIKNADMYKPEGHAKDITSIRLRELMESMFNGSVDIIINNSPAIHYRDKITEAVDVHPKGSMLVNKMTTDGRTIPGDIYLELCDFYNGKKDSLSAEESAYNEKVSVKESTFAHIKDRHYTREMFTVTFSYTMNKAVSNEHTIYTLNEKVRNDIRENGCNIMSVIRGVDNLLYYVILGQDGKVIESGDLNTVGSTNFYEKLSILGRQRYIDGKNWKFEKKVAELKDCYLGQVCRKIAKIAVANNAIICVDRISEKVRNRFSAFDCQVYKKFENQLVATLADFYDISLDKNEPGGASNPLQLAVKDDNTFQNGIIFYVQEANVRNVCMKTGFVNLLSTFNISTVPAKMKFLTRMSDIYYDGLKDEYVFEFSWDKLGCTLGESEIPLYKGMNKVWQVRTNMTRYKRNKEKKCYEEVNGTELIKAYISKKHKEMIGKRIDVTELDAQGVNLLFEMFTLFINGYLPRMNDEESAYISPVSGWTNIGRMAYDEMTALQLARKVSLTIRKIMQGKEGKDISATRVEWLNYLLENAENQ